MLPQTIPVVNYFFLVRLDDKCIALFNMTVVLWTSRLQKNICIKVSKKIKKVYCKPKYVVPNAMHIQEASYQVLNSLSEKAKHRQVLILWFLLASTFI